MLTRIITILLFLTLAFPLQAQTDESGVRLSQNGSAFSAALSLRAGGSNEAAVDLLRGITKDQDSLLSDYAQFEIGETYFKSGNYKAALPEYNEVLARYSDSLLLPRAYLMLGKSNLNLKNYPQALKNFRLLIEESPDAREVPEARFSLAKTLQQQGQWRAAYLAYEETDLYHPLSSFGKQARLAIKALKKTHRKKLPRFKASAEALFKKGMTFFEQDDFESAVATFSRLAREYPRSKYVGEAWLMLGRAELQTNSPDAISDLERAAADTPNLSGRASYYLGQAYGRRGDYERAIAALKKVSAKYPDSDFADEALYWTAYYQELSGDTNAALQGYYALIKNYSNSSSVPAAIWRIGRAYYWVGDNKNAATYLHLAQLYPPGEDTARCNFFEAKALEKNGDRTGARVAYEKLVQRFDHTYYAYRSREKLRGLGSPLPEPNHFDGEEFAQALENIDDNKLAELAAIMEIWEQTQSNDLTEEGSREAQLHLAKYKEFLNQGIANYAADEARYLVDLTSDAVKDSAQIKLGEMLARQGEFRAPIRFADGKIKAAVLSGNPAALPKKIWQLAYPRAYWPQVKEKASSFGLDPYLSLAVIREESRFNPRAVSHSGARGLMQIMPKTGRGIARDLSVSRFRTRKLFTPALNIQMGSYFLSSLVKNFGNNFYLALAGYNGGPNKINSYVKNWYNSNLGAVDVDDFVESIPARETRLYVQKVMGSYFEYKRLYDRKRG